MEGAVSFKKFALLMTVVLFSEQGFARLRLNTQNSEITNEEQPSLEPSGYGDYRIQLGLTKPTFTDLGLYDKLYGDTPMHVAFGVDWVPWKKFVGAGLRTKIGYFSDEGNTFTTDSNEAPPAEEDIEINKDGKTTFTIIPIQVAALVEFAPFSKKYIVFDAWLGFEYAYFQEVRVVDNGEESSSTNSSTTPSTSSNDEDREEATASNDSKALTNSGWKRNMVFGFGVNFQLNALDETSTRSMRSTMGIDSVYITPYMEVITGGGESLKLGRNTYGVSFTFETL